VNASFVLFFSFHVPSYTHTSSSWVYEFTLPQNLPCTPTSLPPYPRTSLLVLFPHRSRYFSALLSSSFIFQL